MRQSLTHLRRNAVAYLALVLAVGTGTAYAAAAIPDGSVTAAKLHKNSVTSNKVKNGSLKPKDLKKPTYVQSATLGAANPPAPTPDVVSIAPYNFTLPTKGRATVTVFIPALTTSCTGGTPSVGLYIDTVAIAGTRTNVPGTANTRPIQPPRAPLVKGGPPRGSGRHPLPGRRHAEPELARRR